MDYRDVNSAIAIASIAFAVCGVVIGVLVHEVLKGIL